MTRRLLPALIVVAMACGDDSPTGPAAGTRMSVEEQVAIEAALNTLVVKLQATGQSADSALADWTRVAARLARRQGYQGTLVVSHLAPATPAETMYAVAMLITLGSGTGAAQLHYLIAWNGLDVTGFTLRDAVIILADGNGQIRGTFPLGGNSPSQVSRYVNLREDRGPYAVITGSLVVDGGRFGGDCPDTPNQPGFRCEAGQETVSGTYTAVWADQADTVSVSWDAAAVPTFRLTVEQ